VKDLVVAIHNTIREKINEGASIKDAKKYAKGLLERKNLYDEDMFSDAVKIVLARLPKQ